MCLHKLEYFDLLAFPKRLVLGKAEIPFDPINSAWVICRLFWITFSDPSTATENFWEGYAEI